MKRFQGTLVEMTQNTQRTSLYFQLSNMIKQFILWVPKLCKLWWCVVFLRNNSASLILVMLWWHFNINNGWSRSVGLNCMSKKKNEGPVNWLYEKELKLKSQSQEFATSSHHPYFGGAIWLSEIKFSLEKVLKQKPRWVSSCKNCWMEVWKM